KTSRIACRRTDSTTLIASEGSISWTLPTVGPRTGALSSFVEDERRDIEQSHEPDSARALAAPPRLLRITRCRKRDERQRGAVGCTRGCRTNPRRPHSSPPKGGVENAEGRWLARGA